MLPVPTRPRTGSSPQVLALRARLPLEPCMQRLGCCARSEEPRVPETTYRQAVARGIAQEMERDDTVVLIGEDVGAAGGVFKLTDGLFDQFGPDRVRDTPISEQAIVGAAMGAAMTGLRPIAE